MKQSYFLFLGGVILIGIGLWDYFSLRMLPDVTKTEEGQQLVVGIVGALLLVFSPLFEQNTPKWMLALAILFLLLTVAVLLVFAFSKPYADVGYVFRHILGLVVVLLLLFLNIRSLKNGEDTLK